MIIRKAHEKDSVKATKLIWTAIENCANAFAGSNDSKIIEQKLNELFEVPYNRMSYEICTIAEEDNEVIGAMITYPGQEKEELDKKIIDRLIIENPKGSSGYNEFVKPILEAREAFDDEYYIDSLAVDEHYRGQKIGTKLIAHAEKLAKKKGFDKVSILAEEYNTKACALYRRLGFEDDCILVVSGHSYNHLVKKI